MEKILMSTSVALAAILVSFGAIMPLVGDTPISYVVGGAILLAGLYASSRLVRR